MAPELTLYFVLSVIISVVNGGPQEYSLEMGCYGEICWKNTSYPTEKINQKMMSLDKSFLETIGPVEHQNMVVKPMKTCGLCSTMVNLRVEPLTILDDYGKSYFIVNSKKYQRTEIDLNICSGNQQNSRCLSQWKPLDFVPDCKQKTTMMNVLAYDEEKNEFVGKSFSYPSSCECIVRKLSPL